MEDIGKRVQQEVEARLGGILADEELAGLVDAALPKVRKRLEQNVEDRIYNLSKDTIAPYLDNWRGTENYEKFGETLTATLVERVLACYQEDSIAIAEGKEPPYGAMSGGKPVSTLVKVVEEGFLKRLAQAVSDRLEALEEDGRLDLKQTADSVVAKLLPKAAATFMASGATSLLRGFASAVQNSQVFHMSGMGVDGGNCPSCCTQLKRCPKCNQLRPAFTDCCGEYLS